MIGQSAILLSFEITPHNEFFADINLARISFFCGRLRTAIVGSQRCCGNRWSLSSSGFKVLAPQVIDRGQLIPAGPQPLQPVVRGCAGFAAGIANTWQARRQPCGSAERHATRQSRRRRASNGRFQYCPESSHQHRSIRRA
jgi:hypothetical protein